MGDSTLFMKAADTLRKEIENELMSIGLLCRVFGRGKSEASLLHKINSTPDKYRKGLKLIQDAVGIRIAVYFQDDIEIVHLIMNNKYSCKFDDSNIDIKNENVFSVIRYNIVYNIPDNYIHFFPSEDSDRPVDRSFELQIRTILSEGWHEVEHDLRYKRKEDWCGSDDLSRGLNGVLATLETAEWSMGKIFDELSYKHYKNKNWDALLHSALRLRISGNLDDKIVNFFNSHPSFARELIKINRASLIKSLCKMKPKIPLTANNIVFIWNRISVTNETIKKMEPKFIAEILDNANLMEMQCE